MSSYLFKIFPKTANEGLRIQIKNRMLLEALKEEKRNTAGSVYVVANQIPFRYEKNKKQKMNPIEFFCFEIDEPKTKNELYSIFPLTIKKKQKRIFA